MLNQQIGSYKIIAELGEGGMATVYLAEKGALGKQVALKVLKKEFIYNQHIRGRFLSEAKKMINLNHPNIVGVQDLIDESDFVAIELEYIEGETLKQHLHEKGALPDDEIEGLFEQMLDAVGYVHEKGYIHRDIKPSNFMLTQSGIIKLTDFGIAKNGDDTNIDYTGTGTGMQMGTPKYMSPEQVRSSKDVDHRSDIYSLGVVLWEMVTGKVPYDIETESTFDVFRKIVDESLELTNTKWDKVIERATSKDVENRYARIDEVVIPNNTSPVQPPKKEKKNLVKGNGIKSYSSFNKYDLAVLLVISLGLIVAIIRGVSSNNELDSGLNSWEEKRKEKEESTFSENEDSKQQIELENEDFDEVNSNEFADFNSFIDNRDGKVYNTVQIGDQVWMAENLAYEPSSGNYWAYADDQSYVEKYGYLYDWETACKACPDGWHLPSNDEWNTLIEHLGGKNVAGKKMKSTNGWQNNSGGTNESRFSGLPGGFRSADGSSHNHGEIGYWWSNLETSNFSAVGRYLDSNPSCLYPRYSSSKEHGKSVRCVEGKVKSFDSLKSSFSSFYKKFLSDSSFQMTRINFPLDGENVYGYGENDVLYWTKDNWIKYGGVRNIYEIDKSRYSVEINESEHEVIHYYFIENSGFSIEYKYAKIKGEWFLVYLSIIDV